MELAVKNGRVVWEKVDGSISQQEVPVLKILDFLEFPLPWPGRGGMPLKATVLKGDPVRDGTILVDAYGRGWGCRILLSRLTGDKAVVRKGEEEIVEELLTRSLRESDSLEQLVEEWRERQRQGADLDSLAQQRGLKVWVSSFHDGYWGPDCGELKDFPAGWEILPRGDASLTRRVRRGPHWILYRKEGKYSVELGTLAPMDHIEQAIEELGGEKGADERRRAREAGQEKRESVITGKLDAALRRVYPGMPASDREEILERARQPGRVGAAQWIYFATSSQSEEAFELAAKLAARAHARHGYAGYDKVLFNWRESKG